MVLHLNLTQAIAELEAKFPPTQGDETPAENRFVTIASGGVKAEGATYPALCNSEETAVRLWVKAIHAEFPYLAGTLYWREKPTIEAFHITMADKFNTQRLVANRYAVHSRLWIAEAVHVKADLTHINQEGTANG